ncbi:MAG: tetraacyldisaccharide 4'-kinase [Alphaproteobacteria bacterium]|nr:tetraacyldisaccharide 4'-kinase [Alphaproteobacteria bacterium]
MRPPAFWREDGIVSRLLAPLGWLYAGGSAVRTELTRPARAPVPVLCVGNPTIGGAGKTPVVQALVAALQTRGVSPHVLLRGYGGRLAGPLRVDQERRDAAAVGDEALLHARVAPTWVARDRAAGARAAAAAGADVLVLDDGFQNPTLRKDLSILVVDGAAGLGAERVFPAGPLREPLDRALRRAQAIVLMGEDSCGLTGRLAGGPPILRARLAPRAPLPFAAGEPVVAFAGIGRPEKFFETVRAAGADVAATRPFPDHHAFTRAEIDALAQTARDAGAALITTEKDAVRLGAPLLEALSVRVLRVTARFEDPSALDALIAPYIRCGPRASDQETAR